MGASRCASVPRRHQCKGNGNIMGPIGEAVYHSRAFGLSGKAVSDGCEKCDVLY